MAERETVIVDGDRRSPIGWLVGLAIFILLIILFFALGGANLFNGTSGTDTVNVDVPDTVQVQPTTQP